MKYSEPFIPVELVSRGIIKKVVVGHLDENGSFEIRRVIRGCLSNALSFLAWREDSTTLTVVRNYFVGNFYDERWLEVINFDRIFSRHFVIRVIRVKNTIDFSQVVYRFYRGDQEYCGSILIKLGAAGEIIAEINFNLSQIARTLE